MNLLKNNTKSLSLWDYTGFDGFCYVTINNTVFSIISYVNPQGRELEEVLDMNKISLYIAMDINGNYKKKPHRWHGSDFKLK